MEAAMTYLRTLFRNYPGENEENHEEPLSGYVVTQPRLNSD
jgi:hypothetical protein